MESHQKLRNLFNLTFFGTPGFLSESPESWNVVPKLFTPHPNRFEIRPLFSHDEEMQGLKKQERKRGNDEKYRVRPLLILSLFPEPYRQNFRSVGRSEKKIIYQRNRQKLRNLRERL